MSGVRLTSRIANDIQRSRNCQNGSVLYCARFDGARRIWGDPKILLKRSEEIRC